MCIIPALLAHGCCIQPVQRGYRALGLQPGKAKIAGDLCAPAGNGIGDAHLYVRSVLGLNCTPNPGVEGVNLLAGGE